MISFLAASFYGSSHAALPLADARSTTSISFRLRTSRPEALIVLAAGRMDYCLVMMQGGAIKVSGGKSSQPTTIYGRRMMNDCFQNKHGIPIKKIK